MASSDYITDVGVQRSMQEIEAIPVGIPIEQPVVNYNVQHMQLALQPVNNHLPSILLQPKTEIIPVDSLSSYQDIHNVSVTDAVYDDTSSESSKKSIKFNEIGNFANSDCGVFTGMKTKRWEQKRVQIRTLEGEFSVTMWASGTDDGMLNISCFMGL